MSETPKPKPRIDSSIIAALIGLAGTIIVALTSILANRSASPQATAASMTATMMEIPLESGGGELIAGLPTDPALEAVPTVKYPDGKRFQLFYDENSFYLLNLSDTAIPINRVAFERLSDEDVALNRFNGTRWAEFYPDSDPGKCVVLQILGNPPYLDPPECGQGAFLSLRTPTREDPGVFWTVHEASHQFRVLWREGGEDEEIARCEISAGLCQVYLP